MDPRNLLHIADVVFSCGAPANQPPNPFTIPTPSVTPERFSASHSLHRSHAMPHIDMFLQQNNQSPPPDNRAPAPTSQTRSPLASPDTRRHPIPEQFPDGLIEQFAAILGRFGLSVTELPPQTTSQSANPSPPSSPPSTLALSKCEPRRNPYPVPQTHQDSGVAGVRFTLPATGQRTGANPNSTPLVTAASASLLPSHKPKWDNDDRYLILKSANRQQ